VELGSGGGVWAGAGGNGGGRVFITAGNIANDGAIRADGGLSAGTASGEGSGGTLNIDTGELAGSGILSANGGTAEGTDHVGGGGRIAVRFSAEMTLPLGNIHVLGGDGNYGDGPTELCTSST
jgi:hypothetical protein